MVKICSSITPLRMLCKKGADTLSVGLLLDFQETLSWIVISLLPQGSKEHVTNMRLVPSIILYQLRFFFRWRVVGGEHNRRGMETSLYDMQNFREGKLFCHSKHDHHFLSHR